MTTSRPEDGDAQDVTDFLSTQSVFGPGNRPAVGLDVLATKVAVDFEPRPDGLAIFATVRTDAKTGVEMEALTAVSLAALTVYDMVKAIDHTMEIGPVRLVEKTKTDL